MDEKTFVLSASSYGKKAVLADALSILAGNQKLVSGIVPGAIPHPDGLVTKDQMRTYVLALVVETAEFLQTMDWKPWKSSGIVTLKESKFRTTDEFADILAFLGLIVLYLDAMGISQKDLAEAYVEKSKVNMQRFEERFIDGQDIDS